jgi:hypothetical protein
MIMDVKAFTKLLRKRITAHTGQIQARVIRYSTMPGTIAIINKDDTGLFVKFKEEHPLTIFEAALLYCASRGWKPADYAQFHKCEAGARFIDNIQSITLLKPVFIPAKVEMIKGDVIA